MTSIQGGIAVQVSHIEEVEEVEEEEEEEDVTSR